MASYWLFLAFFSGSARGESDQFSAFMRDSINTRAIITNRKIEGMTVRAWQRRAHVRMINAVPKVNPDKITDDRG
jgi:hypothetical protein